MGEILGLDGKPLEGGFEPREVSDKELAEIVAERFVFTFLPDVKMTEEQHRWVFARIYHLMKVQAMVDEGEESE
jgi:hypothetical protein